MDEYRKYLENNVIKNHRRSIRWYLGLMVTTLVGIFGLTVYIGYLSLEQMKSLRDLLEFIKNAGVLDSIFNEVNKKTEEPIGIYYYYGLAAFFAFIMVVFTGLIKFHLKEIAKAQHMIYGFMRFGAAKDEEEDYIKMALIDRAFPDSGAQDIEVHSGLEAITNSLNIVSENISKILARLRS